MPRPDPLSLYLPFNRDCLGDRFVPAKRAADTAGAASAAEPAGHWLIVQDQGLVVARDGDGWRLPHGPRPRALEDPGSPPLHLGTLGGIPCWTASLPADAALPAGLVRETLVPMQGTRLPDELLCLGGMAMQALHWESTSGHCPRCGGPADRIPGEWGKRCPRCGYEHFPHLHPAVIVLVKDGPRCLLTRKAGWAPGRYGLVAGFVDNGESLEGAARREVKEEVGVDVADLRYVGSQNWPFPSQLMIGFVGRYAGGELAVDREELEDARWFPCDGLPARPSRHSIAGFILDHYACP